MPRVRGIADGMLQLVSGSLLGLFGLTYAAYWIPPEAAWWLQLLAVGLPLLVAALGALALVLFWHRRWLLLGGVLLALLLYGLRHGRPGGAEPSGAEADDTLVVMTYNVPESRRPALGDSLQALVLRYRPQLIGFQEVGVWRYEQRGRPSTVRLIGHLRPLVERQGFRFSVPDPTRGPMFAEVVTLTHLPVVRQEIRLLERGPEGLIYQAVRSELCWAGRLFVHYNVRLQSYGPVKPWEVLRDGGWKRPANWRRWLGATGEPCCNGRLRSGNSVPGSIRRSCPSS
nr:hypothetical protein [Rhodothermus marinus]